MKLSLLNSAKLGVDIGSRTVKAVKLKAKSGRVYLDRHFFYDLAATSQKYPEESNIPEVLRAAVELQSLQKSKVATSLRDNDMMYFNLILPKLNKKELDIAVAHELSEHTSIPIQELAFDYLCEDQLDATRAQDDAQVNIKAYCAKIGLVRKQMALLESANLKSDSIESDMLAITAMLKFNGYLAPGEVYTVFDWGESHLAAGLIAQGELKFVRSAPLSCGFINEKLKAKMNVNYAQAESFKLNYDFNSDHSSKETGSKAIDESIGEIFREVKDAIDFFKEYAEYSTKIDRVFLVGGGSQAKNLARVYEMFFKIPTEVVNPFRNIELYSSAENSQEEGFEKIVPYMATAVGLALRGIDEK